MTRWLLPLIAMLALCGRAVTAFAAAGWVGNTACCCPDPRTCKCHDHDRGRRPGAELKRCGGDAKLVAPDAPVVVLAPRAPDAIETVCSVVVEVALPPALSTLPVPPEPPPI